MFSPESHPDGFPVYGDMPSAAMVKLVANSVFVWDTESMTLNFEVFGPYHTHAAAKYAADQLRAALQAAD